MEIQSVFPFWLPYFIRSRKYFFSSYFYVSETRMHLIINDLSELIWQHFPLSWWYVNISIFYNRGHLKFDEIGY